MLQSIYIQKVSNGYIVVGEWQGEHIEEHTEEHYVAPESKNDKALMTVVKKVLVANAPLTPTEDPIADKPSTMVCECPTCKRETLCAIIGDSWSGDGEPTWVQTTLMCTVCDGKIVIERKPDGTEAQANGE